MSLTFDGSAIALDLLSIFRATQNLNAAMVKKGMNTTEAELVDYANLIRGFYVAAPESESEPTPEPTPELETYTPVDIHLGDSVTFNLSATSPANPYREGQCKPFTLIWPEINGPDVVIALNIVDTSDTYLQLIDSAGSVVHEDDDGGGSANALLKFNYADYSAPLTVVATTYGQNNYASMTITVTAPNPKPIAEPIPTPTPEPDPLVVDAFIVESNVAGMRSCVNLSGASTVLSRVNLRRNPADPTGMCLSEPNLNSSPPKFSTYTNAGGTSNFTHVTGTNQWVFGFSVDAYAGQANLQVNDGRFLTSIVYDHYGDYLTFVCSHAPHHTNANESFVMDTPFIFGTGQ